MVGTLINGSINQHFKTLPIRLLIPISRQVVHIFSSECFYLKGTTDGGYYVSSAEYTCADAIAPHKRFCTAQVSLPARENDKDYVKT